MERERERGVRKKTERCKGSGESENKWEHMQGLEVLKGKIESKIGKTGIGWMWSIYAASVSCLLLLTSTFAQS